MRTPAEQILRVYKAFLSLPPADAALTVDLLDAVALAGAIAATLLNASLHAWLSAEDSGSFLVRRSCACRYGCLLRGATWLPHKSRTILSVDHG
jgi:hypothetical protein